MMGPIVRAAVRDITKRFPGVVANDAITLDFHAGEIHVLLGENGAGKSTLIGMLAGMLQPDAGAILVDGRPVVIASPRASLDLGIGTVFQHVLLVPTLSVIANLMLGGTWWRGLRRGAALARFRELSALLGVAIDPDARVGSLSLGEQQQVEIMRALWHGERVLILDEPTSMLTPQGVRDLGAVLARLRERGVAIILITHKLAEAYRFGDRISVLRRGQVVGALSPDRLELMDEQAASDAVIEMMFGAVADHEQDADILVGRGRRALRRHAVDRSAAPRLQARDLTTETLRGVSLDLWPGEVLGIAGIDGNGQKHLAETLAGQRAVMRGSIALDGIDITRETVAERRRRGLRYVTDERVGEGIVSGFSLAANLLLKEIGTPPFWHRGITDWNRIHAHGRDAIARHDIRAPSEQTPVGRLSGGNIQKVLLARELDEAARVVLYNKPTQGLDLQNTRLAHDRILSGAEGGLATLVISTDLAELLDLCDRIAVMVQGRIVGMVENGPNAERAIGTLMTGARVA